MKLLGMDIPAVAVGILAILLLIIIGALALIFNTVTAAVIQNSPIFLGGVALCVAIYLWKFRQPGSQEWATAEETLMAFYGAKLDGTPGRVRFGKTYNTVRIGPMAAHPVKMKNRGLWAFCGEMGVNPHLGVIFLSGYRPTHGNMEWSHKDISWDSEKIMKIDRDSEPIDISIQKIVKERLAEKLQDEVSDTLG